MIRDEFKRASSAAERQAPAFREAHRVGARRGARPRGRVGCDLCDVERDRRGECVEIDEQGWAGAGHHALTRSWPGPSSAKWRANSARRSPEDDADTVGRAVVRQRDGSRCPAASGCRRPPRADAAATRRAGSRPRSRSAPSDSGTRSRSRATRAGCTDRWRASRRADETRGSTRGRRGTSSRPSRCTRSSRRGRRAATRRRRRRRRRRARLCSAGRPRACSAWLIGFSIEKSSRGLVAVAERGEGDHRPDGGMRVLAAVLADARRVALDVAGVERRAVERRREEQDEPVVAAHEVSSTAAIARAARAGSPAPEITPQDCAIESMRHPSFAAEPSGVPSSK